MRRQPWLKIPALVRNKSILAGQELGEEHGVVALDGHTGSLADGGDAGFGDLDTLIVQHQACIGAGELGVLGHSAGHSVVAR